MNNVFTRMLIVAGAFVVSACSTPEPPPPAPPEPVVEVSPYHLHTVKYGGETLGLIAAWYTGSKNNWKSLADANPELKPSSLLIGTEIRIPREVLKREDDLPRDFIPKRSASNKRPATRTSGRTDSERQVTGESGNADDSKETSAMVEVSDDSATMEKIDSDTTDAAVERKTRYQELQDLLGTK